MPRRLVYTHDRIMAIGTDKSRLLSVVGAAMVVVTHAIGQLQSIANRRAVQPTREVHPFPTVRRPCLPAKRDWDAGFD